MSAQTFVATEDLAKAAYAGCFKRYGHPHTRNLEKAWEWLGDDQRQMWRDCAESMMEKFRKVEPA